MYRAKAKAGAATGVRSILAVEAAAQATVHDKLNLFTLPMASLFIPANSDDVQLEVCVDEARPRGSVPQGLAVIAHRESMAKP